MSKRYTVTAQRAGASFSQAGMSEAEASAKALHLTAEGWEVEKTESKINVLHPIDEPAGK